MDFKQRYEEYKEAVDVYLSELFVSNVSYPIIYDSIRYSLLSEGKRIRPILTLEFARLGGIDWKDALPYACALEMVHTYSLIHDDLPCMDDDDLRRGKPTNHKVYGECLAVLAGDALQPEAFSLICNSSFDDRNKVQAMKVLSSACGVDGMVSGQVLDTVYDIKDQDGLKELNFRKTGRMIIAAAELGCVASNMFEERLAQAKLYSEKIGFAFQIQDDILDIIGDESVFGKPIGSDKEENKTTFASLLGVEKSKELVESLTAEAIDAVSNWEDNQFLIELANTLMNRNT